MASKKKKVIKKDLHILKKYDHDIILISIPLILLVIFAILSQVSSYVQESVKREKIVKESQTFKIIDYGYFLKPIEPAISAQSAIIIDSNSKVVTYAKNPSLRFSMASTTKIMTSLVALDYFKPLDVLTVYRSNVEGVNVGFEVGEQLYFEDVLYAMMLPSGNDAAYIIADNYPGGIDGFIAAMNKKTEELYMPNTRYADPAGLNDDGNFTTVNDLARLASFAITQPKLAEVMGTRSRFIMDVPRTKSYQLENLNRLLGVYGVIAGKTGYTEGAGGVLVTHSIINGHSYIVVVMKSDDRFADTETLLSYISKDTLYFSPEIFK
ncbi:MAG: hypothetical protein QG600_238 [Patescibacteria group bacterium]|nr:hypothetical protein [Patescibacteria group bacterium]